MRISTCVPFRTLPVLAAVIMTTLAMARCADGQADPESKHGPGWPQWRGPRQDAVSDEPITLWPPVKLWETNAGPGVSSPIALGGRMVIVDVSSTIVVWENDEVQGLCLTPVASGGLLFAPDRRPRRALSRGLACLPRRPDLHPRRETPLLRRSA